MSSNYYFFYPDLLKCLTQFYIAGTSFSGDDTLDDEDANEGDLDGWDDASVLLSLGTSHLAFLLLSFSLSAVPDFYM